MSEDDHSERVLAELGADVPCFSHTAVHTVADWSEVDCSFPAGAKFTKCLFLKGKKGELVLVVALGDTKVDLKLLAKALQKPSGSLRFGSDDILFETLGVRQGAVNPFAVMLDTEKKVTVVVDDTMATCDDVLLFHPMRNDRTVAVTYRQLCKFWDTHAHAPISLSLSG
eukprot:CAMPEP_0177629426 /NCGR_PEP_ID=MMETSP0447-20121125/660_1 /TAXON_ID=0 /ORGANISM="Stygamoeba regulata, Strain BSH-02190019" /LENGTH=168 /DNA_ID=CAMNT_0019130743 /DNA_START=84 /DNA_END=590 /DNA_ORIENTATION=+